MILYDGNSVHAVLHATEKGREIKSVVSKEKKAEGDIRRVGDIVICQVAYFFGRKIGSIRICSRKLDRNALQTKGVQGDS